MQQSDTGAERPKDMPLLRLSQKEAWKSLFWIILILGGIYWVAHQFGFEDIRAWVDRLGVWAPLALIALKASTLVFAPLGGSPLYPVAGALFGTEAGVAYILIGDAIGSTACFFISRRWGMRVARYFLGDGGMTYLDRILSYLGTTRGLVEARIFFIAMPEAVAYAAGLTTLSFWKFFAIHMGIYLVPTILYVMAGDVLLSDNPALFLVGAIALSSLALIGLYWFYKKMHAPHDDQHDRR